MLIYATGYGNLERKELKLAFGKADFCAEPIHRYCGKNTFLLSQSFWKRIQEMTGFHDYMYHNALKISGVNEAWCEWGMVWMRHPATGYWMIYHHASNNACFKWLIPVFVCPILVEIPGSLVPYPVTIVDESCDWVVAVFVGSAKIQEHRFISKFIKSPFRVKCSQLIFNK